jgi:hypothetical protein
MNNIFKFDVGVKVTDSITGFTGVIMARTEYLTGCNRYGILREEISATEPIPDWEWLDETRLRFKSTWTGTKWELVKAKVKIKINVENDPGGSSQNAPK